MTAVDGEGGEWAAAALLADGGKGRCTNGDRHCRSERAWRVLRGRTAGRERVEWASFFSFPTCFEPFFPTAKGRAANGRCSIQMPAAEQSLPCFFGFFFGFCFCSCFWLVARRFKQLQARWS
jgi:hypothetical protein